MPDSMFEEERVDSSPADRRPDHERDGSGSDPRTRTHTRPYTAYSYRHEEQFELRRAHLHTTTNGSGERRAGAKIRRGAESYACGREAGDDSQASIVARSRKARRSIQLMRSGAEIRDDVPEFRNEADELAVDMAGPVF